MFRGRYGMAFPEPRTAMRYWLSPKNPDAHLFGVVLEVDGPAPAGQRLELPAWAPGSYMIRDFARHIISLRADGPGGPVIVDKQDKQTWVCAPCDGPLRVTYEVYAWDASVRAAALDSTGGFCDGAGIFLRPIGLPDGPFEMILDGAGGCPGWRAITAMPPVAIDEAGFGRYRAADYEELIDHPVRFGTWTELTFTAADVPHRVIVSEASHGAEAPASDRMDGERLCRDLATVCEAQARLFGEHPAAQYLFIMHPTGSGFGGLEHRASTVLDVARDSLPVSGDPPGGTDAYQELLGLCSHEYFHLWNVKRIRPAALVRADLSREAYTTLLWAFEGITSYYDDLTLCRTGLVPVDAWLKRLARTVTRVHRGAGRTRQTLMESSFDAWTRFYKADENAPNAIVSYYAKGALTALALDLTIRLRTDGRCSLDEVMRALWQRHGRTGEGVPEDGIECIAQEVSGLDLTDFFEAALRSTRDLDLAGLLTPFGIELHWQCAQPGGGLSPHLGAGFRDDNGIARLQQIHEGRAAQRAGLAPGDRVIAVDGIHLPAASFGERVARLPVAEPLPIHVLRGDRLLTRSLALDPNPNDECRLAWIDQPVAEARQRRHAWLGREA